MDLLPHLIASPFPHVVVDRWASASECRAAATAWPAPDWSHWVRYDADEQTKVACPDWRQTPEPCRDLLARMMLLPLSRWFGIPHAVPDALLWGGGLHAMGRGGRLGVHLDHARHPLTGLARVFSCVLFLDDAWHPQWGGQLALLARDRTTVVRAYAPEAGRLVVFQTTPDAYHAVLGPLACPEGTTRKTLAVFYHAAPQPSTPDRTRAAFFYRDAP